MNHAAPTRKRANPGGTGLRTGPGRNHPDDQFDVEGGEASGAPMRNGTTRPQELDNETAAGDLDAELQRPVELAIPGRRMRWSRAMNLAVMRAYYIASRCEEDVTGYRDRICDPWLQEFPEMNYDSQRLSDQVRSILRRKALTEAELQAIKQQVRESLNANEDTTQEDETNPTQQTIPINDDEDRVDEDRVDEENQFGDAYNEKLRSELEKTQLEFIGIPPALRPSIPKINYNQKSYEAVKSMNIILERKISECEALQDTHHLVYCAAYAVTKFLGISGKQRKIGNNMNHMPPWKKRLESKINTYRKLIGPIETYLKAATSTNRKLKNTVKGIAKRASIKSTDPDYRQKLTIYVDNLKQKVAALGTRLRRYNKRTKKYSQNKLFCENQGVFYKTLSEKNTDEAVDKKPPQKENMSRYWRDIWSRPVKHQESEYWISDEEERCRNMPEMEITEVTKQDIEVALRNLGNWKCPGPDKIQNYWWKNFSSVHGRLAEHFQTMLYDPTTAPEFLTEGYTIMLPKSGDLSLPKNYRPITCLPSVYKILTSVIKKKIETHLNENNVLAHEQNGCKKGSQGCKELLVTDTIVTRYAKNKNRNLSVAWIDYRKAFDSVPHTWLIRILRLYKVNERITMLLQHLMQTWRTSLLIKTKETSYQTNTLEIKRGIFQGDSLSPLWFCLALNPLSEMLRQSSYGFGFDRGGGHKISHAFYMDDLKIYASNSEQLQGLLELVNRFSRAIKMEFGVEKCAILHMKRGKVTNEASVQLMDTTEINALEPGTTYKYLGFQQGLTIDNTQMKKKVENELRHRIKKVLRTELNAINKITAINTWAMPVITFTFGVLRWTKTDLEGLDRMVRTLLTSYRSHHPQSSCCRLYLPRRTGGRGLCNLENAHQKQSFKLHKYFKNKNLPLHQAISRIDKNYSPLNLSGAQPEMRSDYLKQLKAEWEEKILHGRFASALQSEYVDSKASITYLMKGKLDLETEGAISAIQDQVAPTRNRTKYILKQDIPSDKCRVCDEKTETIQHIVAGCSFIAPREYLNRHNDVAKIIHQALGIKAKLIKETTPYYKYQPCAILENEDVKIYWDTMIITDRAVSHNKPDIIILHKKERSACIIDVAIPVDDNIRKSVTEKITKYQDLKYEIEAIWKLREVRVIPFIISANGLVEKNFCKYLEKVGLNPQLVEVAQKAAILGTCHIVRKYLQQPI